MYKKQFETGCCERFNPKPWQNKIIIWKNKSFVKDRVMCFFHIPLNFGYKVVKNMKLIDKANAKSKYQMMLTDSTSLFGMDIYIAVKEKAKKIKGAKIAFISGTFLTKVFEGPYSNTGKWAKEMENYVKRKKKKMKKLYFSYTTCPRCAKIYGKNYVVLFAKIK